MFFWSHPWCFGPLGKFQHNIKISIKTARVSRLSVSCDYTLKNLLVIFSVFEQVKNSLRRNSMAYGTSCHAIGHFVFWCHHDTYRTPCHVSCHLVIYRECYGFERALFTLRRFLPHNHSCWFQGWEAAVRSQT